MPHIAELIAVGTELLLGNIANTDAQMISQGLSALGINVNFKTNNYFIIFHCLTSSLFKSSSCLLI